MKLVLSCSDGRDGNFVVVVIADKVHMVFDSIAVVVDFVIVVVGIVSITYWS